MTSEDGVAAVAARLHRLDGATTLVEVLEWLLEEARELSIGAYLFVVRGRALAPWRDAPAKPAGQPFAINVGGRVVAVLCVSSADGSAASALDVLTTHASRVLESMTLHKALGLIPPRIDRRTVRASVAAYLR